MAKYIGANHVNGMWLGGIDSSFNGVFRDEEVLIGSGLDYTPCIIGDITEIYMMFGKRVAERQPNTFEGYSICMMKAIEDYFGDYSNIDERMNNYPDTDFIEDGIPIGKVSDLKGKNAAMCVERAMVAQNLLKLLGINSYYKSSGIIKNGKKDVHSYNVVEYGGRYYIFDATIPTLIDGEVCPIVAEITDEVFKELIPVRNRNGISVEVSHYNPLMSEDVTIIYDSGRDMKYDVTKKEIIGKNK